MACGSETLLPIQGTGKMFLETALLLGKGQYCELNQLYVLVVLDYDV